MANLRRLFVMVGMLLVGAGGLEAAQVQLQVVPAAVQTPQGATYHLDVYLGNPDGTPGVDGAVSPQGGGLPSEWAIYTHDVPAGFATPCIVNRQTVSMQGELFVRMVSKLTIDSAQPTAGLYRFDLAPVAPCGSGVIIRWIPGEYHFLLVYSKDGNRGSALGVLTIK